MGDTGAAKSRLFLAVNAARYFNQLPPSLSQQRCALTAWIRDNVRKRECTVFQRDSRDDLCKCGCSKSEHSPEAIISGDSTQEPWTIHKHVREVQTDAYGEISFGDLGQKTGKYARVSIDTSPEVLYQLLTEHWELSPPNLLISVTGGAKNFSLKAQLKKMFHRGLIKVAQTTGAWIVTGGTHTGVMKHVGQAVRDYTLSSSLQGHIVAIGVATWGVIHNRDALVQPQGCFPAHYVMDIEGQGRLSCLDNNHTHFLLVDDGTQGRYGVEIELRSRLEKCIAGKHLGNKESGVTIPVVCVVLDGGPGTLNTIYNAMVNGTPCVMVEGSGRIADIIAQVSGLPVGQVTIDLIQQLLKKFCSQEYKGFKNSLIIEWTKMIQDIIGMSHLLTVFRVSQDSNGEMDVAILQALLKASRSSGSQPNEIWKKQLELAIAWNRVDIAETEIFSNGNHWKCSDLHDALFSALIGNKPEFVRLLLENGASLRDFLQRESTLCELYRQMPSCFFLRKLAKRVHSSRRKKKGVTNGPAAQAHTEELISIAHVSDEVRHLLGDFTKRLYATSTSMNNFSLSIESSPASLSKSQADIHYQDQEVETRMEPGRDLFLWAIVQNNKELAEIAWDQCTDCISAALAATKILKKMASQGSDADEAEEMLKLADHYEKQAIGVFSECHKSDEERAQKLLVRLSPLWGRTTCLRVALQADDKTFVAQSGVQALLTQIWCGELSVDNPVWRVLLCMVFFPLIYTGFLVFRYDEAIQRAAEKNEELNTVQKMKGGARRRDSFYFDSSELRPLKPLSCWSRLLCLYTSSQVKFYWNLASYFAFLLLFAVVLMVDFQVWPSTSEVLLYVWLLSLVCEEVRQLFHDPNAFGLRKRAKMYISDLWNVLDVLSIVLFIIGLGFRLTTVLFYAGKVILCIDFVVFCLRLMAIFTISRTLGPKIIIVRRMMRDLFFFMFLLSIWVVAYGVAKQGILIENEDRLGWIIRGAVYEPYRIIFGDFPTNIDNAAFDISSCTMNGSDPLKPKCPVLGEDQMPVFPEWLTIILLCIYLLFANILLLNLLIAIFNFTFQEVQDNTDTIWRFQRYELIEEYSSRPAAPPPLIIFSHLFLFIRRWLLCQHRPVSREFQHQLSEMEEEELLSWEALMKDRYLLSTQREQNQSVEQRIVDTAQKVTSISDRLEREEETSNDAVVKRLARLEEQVVQSAKALQWIMESLQSRGFSAKEEPPQMLITTDESSSTFVNTSEKEDRRHVKARQLYYPDSKVTRFHVPEELVPWEVSFSSYDPGYYASGSGEDQVDGSKSEDLNKYRNPAGRTGIRGRGALSHLGPNLKMDLILTCPDSESKVLQYLEVKDKSQGSWVLPGGPLQSTLKLPESLKETFGEKVYEKLNEKYERKEGEEEYSGYADDCRNTDNAWAETVILSFHLDGTSKASRDINIAVSSNSSLRWQKVGSEAGLDPIYRDALRKVAARHNKKF